MKFARLLVRHVLHGVLLVLAVVVLNFGLVHAAPGDPVETIAGASGGMSPELMAQLRSQYGLDQPIATQLGVYLAKVARGDLGYSYFFNMPVAALIADRVPATLLLVLSAVVLAFALGTGLGVLSSTQAERAALAVDHRAEPDRLRRAGVLDRHHAGASCSPRCGRFCRSRACAIQSTGAAGLGDAVDVLHHLVLPTVTLALVYLAQYSRLARSSMLDVLGADFIRTARAKGLPERVVFYKHALRNALLPVVTVLGLQFGNVLAGAILVETVFNWPGLGRLAFESVLRRDYPTILGVLLFAAIVVVVMNLLTDLAYRLIDPRIKV